MKSLLAALFLLPSAPAAEIPSLSPAQKIIATAREQIRKDPKPAQAYTHLALALVRRGRETGDSDYYRQAGRALEDSLRAEPDNFEALKARVLVLLGQREYAE